MKKTVITLAVVAFVAAAAQAQTTSANLVGYTKVNAVGGELTLVALNFSGGSTIGELLGDQVPQGTVVNLWDKDQNTYVTDTKTRAGFSSTSTVELGDALWISAGGSAGATNVIIFSGEVLTDSTNTVTYSTGIEATGYFYPVSTAWTDTDLSVQAPQGSVLNVWNGSSYTTSTKTRGGWSANPTIGVSEGFWLQVPSETTINEVRPFNF
jgi:hypothetical protein